MQDGVPNGPKNVNAQAPSADASPAEVPARKPWYKSRTILAVIVIGVVEIARALGVEIDPDDPAITEVVATLVSLIAAVVAIWGRAKATRSIAVALTLIAFAGCEGFRGSIGYEHENGSSAAISTDGHTTSVDVRLPNPEGLAK